jgi:hypothetical protein
MESRARFFVANERRCDNYARRVVLRPTGLGQRNALGGATLASYQTKYPCGLVAITSPDADAEDFARQVALCASEAGAEFALFFFSKSQMNAEALCAALKRHAPQLHHAGCSTAGEITPEGLVEGQAIAILFPGNAFTAVSAMVRDVSTAGMADITRRVEDLRGALAVKQGAAADRQVFALCFIDGLSFAEEATTFAIHWGLDDIPLLGGSAGDGLDFEQTLLISDGQVATDCAIVVLIATDVPFEIFKADNFVPTSEKLVVTASDPSRRIVHEFNASSAAQEFAGAIGLSATDLGPLSFASHPVVVRVGGEHFCRSIQKVNPDGSLTFFCAIDDGIVLTIAEPKGMVESTRRTLHEVGEKLGGIDVVLGFDCVLRRLDAQNRQVFRDISDLYEANKVIGFGTYGEQYRSMHLNQTLTGIAFGQRQATG